MGIKKPKECAKTKEASFVGSMITDIDELSAGRTIHRFISLIWEMYDGRSVLSTLAVTLAATAPT